MFSFSKTFLQSACSIILPVASPPECKTRLTLCAASRVNVNSPFSSRSNSTPKVSKSFITLSEFSDMNFTVLKSLKPAPALIVSLMCEVVESDLFSFKTPTIPPCAYLELLSPSFDFVISRIPSLSFVCCSSFKAAYKPAIPLPITTAEYFEYFILISLFYILSPT